MTYYNTISNTGKKVEFKENSGFVAVYRDGELWGVPQGQGFLKLLLRDIKQLQDAKRGDAVDLVNEETAVQSQQSVTSHLTRYAVGVCSFEDEIEVILVFAENDFEAICQAVLQKYKWDISLESEFGDVTSVQELITLALQGDINVSLPITV